MKKIILSIAAVASAMLVACSGTKSSDEGKTCQATEFATKIQNCTNPDSIKIYVEQAKDYADKLVKEGKVEQAKQYLDQIEPVVKEKAPGLAGVFTSVSETLDKVGSQTGDAVANAKDSIAGATENAVDQGKEAFNDAKDKVADKAGEIKDKVADKASEATDKVSEKASEAKEKAADKINEILKK